MDPRIPDRQSIHQAKLFAGVLQQLGTAISQEQFASVFTDNFGVPSLVRWRPSTEDVPNLAVVKWEAFHYVFCRGIETWGQGRDLILSPVDVGQNQAGYAYAIQALVLLSSAGWTPGDGVYLAGHSYGGMAVEILADPVLFPVRDSVVEMHTFGQPRAASASFLAGPTPGRSFRWCLTRDIVPHIPPNVWEMPVACGAVGVPLALTWQRQHQQHAGLLLDDDGHIDLYEQDTPLPMSAVVEVIPALLAGGSSLGVRHGLAAYQAALTLADEVIEPGELMLVLPSPARPPVPISGPELIADVLFIRERWSTNFEGGHTLRVNVPNFDVAEVGRQMNEHVVVWEGLIIARFSLKNQARIFARDLNTMVRRGQYATTLRLDPFITALSNYLTRATDPTSGFNPVPSPE